MPCLPNPWAAAAASNRGRPPFPRSERVNTKGLISIVATVATVAAGVIVAGYVIQMGKDLPVLKDAHAGFAGA
jgi:hypothetical protein